MNVSTYPSHRTHGMRDGAHWYHRREALPFKDGTKSPFEELGGTYLVCVGWSSNQSVDDSDWDFCRQFKTFSGAVIDDFGNLYVLRRADLIRESLL